MYIFILIPVLYTSFAVLICLKELIYDEEKTLEENKTAVDEIVTAEEKSSGIQCENA